MKYLIQYLAFLILIGASMSGCGNGIFNKEPFSDSHRDEEGNVILEDTSRMWQNFMESVEPRIAKEIAGKKPDAGKNSWNDYWLWRIEVLPENRENRQKYIDYIIDRRSQEGLPDLIKF